MTESIKTYYEENLWAYKLIWSAGVTRGLHFGYYPNKCRDISHEQAVLNLNSQVACRLNIKPGCSILDCGCGIGGTTVWLAKKHPDIFVHGITIIPSQVKQAESYAAASGVSDRVSFSLTDYTKTGFPPASYDGVFGVEAVCYAQEKADFLSEAFRILKPGGRLVVLDGWRTRRKFKSCDERIFHAGLGPWAVDDLDTPEEFQAKAGRAGFSGIAFENLEDYIRPSHMRLYRMSCWGYPVALALRAVGIFTRSQLGNVTGAFNFGRAVKRGLLVQGVVVADKPGGSRH